MAATARNVVFWLLFLGYGALLAFIGYGLLFSSLMAYDDEGYILWSLRNYTLHGELYSKVYSQYGPFFYVFYETAQNVFNFEYDHVSSRWLTLINWLGAASAASFLTWRYTKSLICAASTLGLTFLYLWVMINEPMHPGGLITILVSLGAVAGAVAIDRKRPVPFVIFGAVIGVALLLTKINVGVFFLVALAGWMLLNGKHEPMRRTVLCLAITGCFVLPVTLMSSLITTGWTQILAVVAITTLFSSVLLIDQNRRPEYTLKTWWVLASTTLISGVVMLAPVYAKGTGTAALIDGVLLSPLKHPNVYTHVIDWKFICIPLGIGFALLALWLYRSSKQPPWTVYLIIGLRLTFFAGFICAGKIKGGEFCQIYGLPLIWIWVIPLRHGTNANDNRARIWLGWVLALQSLHVYPVAGSQIEWGTFLYPGLMVMGLYESVLRLRDNFPRKHLAELLSTGLLLLPCAHLTIEAGEAAAARYYGGVPLGLPGTGKLRVTENRADTLRIITANARLYSRTLFSFPGLYSMNIWTGKPTPTEANTTHWFNLLTPEQQHAIINKIKDDPMACVVIERALINFMAERGINTESPLSNYLQSAFHPALHLSNFALWIKKERAIQPVGVVGMKQTGAGPRLRMEGIFQARDGEIGSIELLNYTHSPQTIQAIAVKSPDVFFSSSAVGLDTAGTEKSPDSKWMKFTLEFTASFLNFDPGECFVVIRNTNGQILDRLQFEH